jgi:hypothetical protein
MALLAAGDRAAVVMLYMEFGRTLSGVVRRHLARFGVSGISREELDGLVLDACFAIGDCASAWDPAAGVAPWTWAERRVAGIVSSFVGQHADDLDESVLSLPAPQAQPSQEPRSLETLTAAQDPMCRLLKAAFVDAGVSSRDQQLLLETRLQASLGDPAPASTVAPLYGMTPVAVRQAVKRSKDRLRRLSDADPSYAPLADLALLA